MTRTALLRALPTAGALAFALAGCDSLTSSPDPPTAPSGLSASAASTSEVEVTWSAEAGGARTVQVERAEGPDPFSAVGSESADAGLFRDEGLSPGTTYRYRIRGCNGAGCSPFTAAVETTTLGVLAVETGALPPAAAGLAYEAELEAEGGDGSYGWVRAEGALPDGLVLSAAGTVQGTPAESGSFDVTVRVRSGDGQTAEADLAVVVFPPLQVTTSDLPNALLGEPYGRSLDARGGDGTYSWERTEGELPEGIALSAAGLLAGRPGALGTERFTVRVTSGDGQSASRSLSLQVVSGEEGEEVVVETRLLPPGLAGAPYDVPLRARGGDGARFEWAVAEGDLPPGLSIDPGGRLEGTPTTPGSSSLTLEVTSGGRRATAAFELRVVADDRGGYHVTPVSVSPVPPAIRSHVDAAVARWQEVITGDMPRDLIPADFFVGSDCAGFGELVNGTGVDDVLILVQIAPIDGPGSILGQAGPCAVRDDRLPVVGVLFLDEDDLDPLVGSETLTSLVFHEIGHVLGYGTLWRALDLVVGSGSGDPGFRGTEAVVRYEALGGLGSVPLENLGGPGTAEAHWREVDFDREVMTGFIDAGVKMPLSEVTIGSMQDLGYAVDFGAADPFSLNLSATRAPGMRSRILGWDRLYRGPVRVLPASGRGRRR